MTFFKMSFCRLGDMKSFNPFHCKRFVKIFDTRKQGGIETAQKIKVSLIKVAVTEMSFVRKKFLRRLIQKKVLSSM